MGTAKGPSMPDPNDNELKQILRNAGLRATRQRLELARLIFGAGHRHISADSLLTEARTEGISVSPATIYNVLNQFTASGLLREIVVDPRRTYFDTNVGHHHHFFHEDDGSLVDIPASALEVSHLPAPPSGTDIRSVDVIVRVARRSS
jgi:Fur family iron response transcriptional regulator